MCASWQVNDSHHRRRYTGKREADHGSQEAALSAAPWPLTGPPVSAAVLGVPGPSGRLAGHFAFKLGCSCSTEWCWFLLYGKATQVCGGVTQSCLPHCDLIDCARPVPPGASLMAQVVKNEPATWTWVLSLGWEDLLEEELATCSSVLARIVPWMEEPAGPRSMGAWRVRHH